MCTEITRTRTKGALLIRTSVSFRRLAVLYIIHVVQYGRTPRAWYTPILTSSQWPPDEFHGISLGGHVCVYLYYVRYIKWEH